MDRADCRVRRSARRASSTSSCRRSPRSRTTSSWCAAVESAAAASDVRVLLEGYPPPSDAAAAALSRHARSRGDRSQRAAGPQLGRARRADHDGLRRGASLEAHRGEVHARRPPHRHWRRQPLRAWRLDRPATARFCGGRICSAASSPTGTITRRCRISSRASSSVPTSQAPRVDEARHDSVYELELAFSRLPRRQRRTPAPWLVDRQLRHFLVDVSRQHAPRRVLHRQALLARQRRADAAGSWSCGRSRCRRTRA